MLFVHTHATSSIHPNSNFHPAGAEVDPYDQMEQHGTIYQYNALSEEEKHSPQCPNLFLRVRQGLWMDVRFIELNVHVPVCVQCLPIRCQCMPIASPTRMQMMIAETTFGRLEEAYGEKCALLKWTCHVPPGSSGRTFCRAWKLFQLVTTLNSGAPAMPRSITIKNMKDQTGSARDGMEQALGDLCALITKRPTDAFHHHTGVGGCGGSVLGGGACRGQCNCCCKAVVMDGIEVCCPSTAPTDPDMSTSRYHRRPLVQVFTGVCCSEQGCRRYPQYGSRFCWEHAHLAAQCGVWLPPLTADNQLTLDSTPSREALLQAYLPDGPHGGVVQGAYCGRPVAHQTAETCQSALCETIHELFRVRELREGNMETDEAGDRRQRELAFQRVSACQRFTRKRFMGHFFYMCPCGMCYSKCYSIKPDASPNWGEPWAHVACRSDPGTLPHGAWGEAPGNTQVLGRDTVPRL